MAARWCFSGMWCLKDLNKPSVWSISVSFNRNNAHLLSIWTNGATSVPEATVRSKRDKHLYLVFEWWVLEPNLSVSSRTSIYSWAGNIGTAPQLYVMIRRNRLFRRCSRTGRWVGGLSWTRNWANGTRRLWLNSFGGKHGCYGLPGAALVRSISWPKGPRE